jgi:AcrR family transcriptional regulator
MDPKPPQVKAAAGEKRRYNASGRQARAARNRAAIIDVAEQQFLENGYATTTIAAIAAEVGVSDHTIYKAFGGKPGLIRAIRERALEGEGPLPAEQRSDQLHDEGRDAPSVIAGWGRLAIEVMPRVAPVLLLIRDAATTDPDVRGLQAEMDADRLRRMTDNARRLRAEGHLRAGLTLTEAADVLWTYSAPELYELLVLRRGWPLARYGTFLTRSMCDALL